jgi:twinkle protein
MIDPSRGSGMTETEHILKSLEAFKAFAAEYEVATFIVAHPNKPLKIPGGDVPVPTAYDISGSAHWFNVADTIVTVWRNPEEAATPTQIHVQKVRFGEVGESGTKAQLDHHRATGRYSDVNTATDVDDKEVKKAKKAIEDNNHFANQQKHFKG